MTFREWHYEIYEASILICFPTVSTIKVNKWILKDEPVIHRKCVLLILSYNPKGEGLS